jgi:hypothetical protein
MTSQQRLEDLRAEARYHRERHELYRAKVCGPRPTSLVRLRELATSPRRDFDTPSTSTRAPVLMGAGSAAGRRT